MESAPASTDFCSRNLYLEGSSPESDPELLILTADQNFAAMSELLRLNPSPGFPDVRRVHGFVDYGGKMFWAVLQNLSTPLRKHLIDPVIPEITHAQLSEFNCVWEEMQANPVKAPDYFDDLDIRTLYHEIDDFESVTNIAFSDLSVSDFSVVGSDTSSPQIIVTALEKAATPPSFKASILSTIPVISVEVTGWKANE